MPTAVPTPVHETSPEPRKYTSGKCLKFEQPMYRHFYGAQAARVRFPENWIGYKLDTDILWFYLVLRIVLFLLPDFKLRKLTELQKRFRGPQDLDNRLDDFDNITRCLSRSGGKPSSLLARYSWFVRDYGETQDCIKRVELLTTYSIATHSYPLSFQVSLCGSCLLRISLKRSIIGY